MRLKHRWVIAQLLHEAGGADEAGSRDVVNALREKMALLYGDIGAGEYGKNTSVRFFDDSTHIFVVRTAREAETQVRLCLSAITALGAGKTSVVVRSLGLHGCARTCMNKLRLLLRRALDAEAAMAPPTHTPSGAAAPEVARKQRDEQYEKTLQSLEL